MLHEVAGEVDPVATLDGNWAPFVEECLRRLYKLVKLRMLVVVVFDGAPNPFKRLEDDRRAARRLAALDECKELRARLADAGRLPTEELQLLQSLLRKSARAAFHRSQELQQALQERLTKAGFRWIVAPFEADSQLAWLGRMGRVEYVISEDADLVVLGCPRLLTKVKVETGTALLVQSEKIFTVSSRQVVPATVRERGPAGLMLLAALAGNDYCKLRGVSLMTAALIMQQMPAGCADPARVPAAAQAAGLSRLLPPHAVQRLEGRGRHKRLHVCFSPPLDS